MRVTVKKWGNSASVRIPAAIMEAAHLKVAYGENGKTVDVGGVETVVPFVVEECKKAPKETFRQKAKAEMKKLEAKAISANFHTRRLC